LRRSPPSMTRQPGRCPGETESRRSPDRYRPPARRPGPRPAGRLYAVAMATGRRQARVEDVHELALGMPHVTVVRGRSGNPVYQVGGKSFVFFRNPRPDAFDPATGERYPDVIMFWVESESDKLALVQDEGTPFFTTPHFDGHPSVLVRGSLIGDLSVEELTE